MISSGKKRLRLTKDEKCFLFKEEDGTEIEDDNCLLEYEKGTLFVISTEWTSLSTFSTGTAGDAVGSDNTENLKQEDLKEDPAGPSLSCQTSKYTIAEIWKSFH